MIVRVLCAALHGVEAFPVDLEADMLRSGMPAFSMVGLAEGAVREARERVFAALRNSGFRLPPARVTINLAPANRRKDGSAYDLPMAAALLASSGILRQEQLDGYMLAGELSLTGEVKSVSGILPIAILARTLGVKALVAPMENSGEAAVVEGLTVYGVRALHEAIGQLAGEISLPPAVAVQGARASPDALLDFAEVKGQEHAKRAIELAAAGGHNLLFLGPPGSGKTMLAQRIPTILPPLDFQEALEVSSIYSVAGMLEHGGGLLHARPFRSPHHTISHAGLVGGGARPRPGEVSLAHRGVLFLDELPEFSKQVLETLRQPMEDGKVTISRAAASLSYPADFMLVAAMNPCPCGYRGDRRRACVCSEQDVRRYRAKLSGPLLDRIDMHVEAPTVAPEDLQAAKPGEDSAAMRARVAAARARQTERYAGSGGKGAPRCLCNADLSGKALDVHCRLDAAGREFLGDAIRTLALSARAYTRILRIARSVADLENAENVSLAHLAEAINCRVLDRRDG